MSAAERLPDAEGFRISFRPMAGGLRAHVTGTSSFAATVAYWRQITVEVRARKPTMLLVIDELRGIAISAQEWYALVEATKGQGLEGVRIAHVRPRDLQNSEYCEIYAQEAGLDARAFDNETTAVLWLRHGGD